MNIKQAAQTIRDTVPMEQILALYGYRTRSGFMRCPFHGDKGPSLKVYPTTGGWHCFGCNKGGSVIDFVMEHEGCDFKAAVNAIDQALNLKLMNPYEHPDDARMEKRIQDGLDNFVEAVYSYCDALLMVNEMCRKRDLQKMQKLEEIQYSCAEKLTADDYTFLMTYKDNDEYAEYQADKIREFKEEVAAWRRKARRATRAP